MLSKVFLRSAAALAIVQVLNMAAPLLVIPVLARALGVEQFGVYAMATALTAFLVIIVDCGVSYTGTRRIALADSALEQWRMLKLLIAAQLAVALAISAGAALIFAALGFHQLPLYVILLNLVAYVFTPTWYFNARSENAKLALSHAAGKMILLSGTGVISVMGGGLLGAVISNVAGNCTTAALAMWFARRTKPHSVVRVHVRESYRAVAADLPFVLSRLAFAAYSQAQPLLLGAIWGPSSSAAYALADRLRQAVQMTYQPFTQALYAAVIKGGGGVAEQRAGFILFVSTVGFSSVLFFGAEWIVAVAAGPEFIEAVDVLRIISAAPTFVLLMNLYGVHNLMAEGRFLAFSAASVVALSIWAIVALPLMESFAAKGAAIALLVAEGTLAILCIFIVKAKAKAKASG